MHAAEPFPHFVDDLPELPLRGAPDQRHDGRRPPARRSARGLPPPGDRSASERAGRVRPAARRHPRRTACRRPSRSSTRSSRRTSALASSSSKTSAPGSATRSSTPRRSPRASPRRPFSTTRPRPTARAASSPSCGRRPRLIQAARENIKEPPAIFVKVGLDTLRGVMTFIDADLPKAFRGLDDLHLLAGSRRRVAGGRAVDRQLRRLPRKRRPPQSQGLVPARRGSIRAEAALRRRDFAVGRSSARDCRARTAHDAGRVPHARRPPERRRSDRELAQEEAADASRAGAAARDRARAARRAADVPQRNADRVAARRCARSRSAPTPDFFRWSFASMWTPGPFETRASARDVLPDRRRSVVAARQADRAPARLQCPDALDHLDPRGVPRPLPALPAPARRSSRKFAARRCSRRRPTSRAGRTTASR